MTGIHTRSQLQHRQVREGRLTETNEQPRQTPPSQLESQVRWLLAQPTDDNALRDKLEQLAAERAFDGLTWLWGPVLYRRNRALFRPFILSHFSDTQWMRRWDFTRVEWKKQVGQTLDEWLHRADADDDIELFKRLNRWKLTDPTSRSGVRSF